MVVGEGCSAELISDAFRELKVNKKCRAFGQMQIETNKKSVLAFMERENYHKAFKLELDSQKALFPMQTITDKNLIFSTKGSIILYFPSGEDLWFS